MTNFLDISRSWLVRRTLAFVLAVALITPSFPIAAVAETDPGEGGDAPTEQVTDSEEKKEQQEEKKEDKQDTESEKKQDETPGEGTPPGEGNQSDKKTDPADETPSENEGEKKDDTKKEDEGKGPLVVAPEPDLPWYEEQWPSDPNFPVIGEFPPFSEEDFEQEEAPMGMAAMRGFSFSFRGDLYIEKELINDDEGTATVDSFSVTVYSLTLSGGFDVEEYTFDETGLIVIPEAPLGLYHVVENDPEGYDVSYDNCNAFLMVLFGGDHTCTVTNDDVEPPAPVIPECSVDETTFDPFSLGSVNGQFGWGSTGSYDQEIVDNVYGIDEFGCKSLRLSNAVTSGSFGDQTFSYSLENEAGETIAENGGKSGGDRQNRFEAQFDIASTQEDLQEGLFISVSPDRGDGARMSYLSFTDTADGIDVVFYDVQSTSNPAVFSPTTIATLDRGPHTIKFVMDFVDGPSNDVVEIYIDGALEHTGTSWENYYRYDDESNPSLIDTSRTVDSLLFRVSGSSAPSTDGEGFLIDNVELESSTVADLPPSVPVNGAPNAITLATNNFTFTWDASTDDSAGPITYEFQSSLNPTEVDGVLTTGLWQSGTLPSNSIVSSGAPDGTWYWQVRAKDDAGNYSAWSEIWTVTLDTDGEVPPGPAESAIIQPTLDEVVNGVTELEAVYADQNSDGNDGVQWAVRAGTCAAGSGTVFGNVDGKNTPFVWNGEEFTASIDTSTVADGEYCFIFNPTEDAGHTNQRLTRTFSIDNSGPTGIEIVFPSAEQIFTTQPILNDWTEATDENGIATYEIAYAYDDGHTFGGSTCPAVVDIDGTPVSGCRQTTNTERNHTPALSEQGGVTIWVRAFDTLGNEGPWSDPVHYYYDETGVGPTDPTFDTETVTVTGNTAAGENEPGWMFNRDPFTATFYEFVDTLAGIGEGSLRIAPITNTSNGNSDKFIAELFLKQPIAEINSVSFDFQIEAPDDTVAEQFYMSIYTNFGESDENKFYDCRYNVVATLGSTSAFTTVTFDPTETYSVTTRTNNPSTPEDESSPYTCPASPLAMDGLSPDSIIRAIAINVGDTSGSDTGVGGYLDNVVVVQTTGAHTQTTIYDFEPTESTDTESDDDSSGGGGGGGGNNNNDDEEDTDTDSTNGDENTFTAFTTGGGGTPSAFAAAGGTPGAGDDTEDDTDDTGTTTEEEGSTQDQTALLANVLSALGLDENPWLLFWLAIVLLGLGSGGWLAYKKFKQSNTA